MAETSQRLLLNSSTKSHNSNQESNNWTEFREIVARRILAVADLLASGSMLVIRCACWVSPRIYSSVYPEDEEA